METGLIATTSALETLTRNIGVESATKENITKLAEALIQGIDDPLEKFIAFKPLEEFINALKEALKEKALKEAEAIPQSKRRIGNLTFDIVTRTNHEYSQSNEWVALKDDLKNLETALKGAVGFTETKYMVVKIPKK